MVVNYDIHWNPVRIIQRFGRVDRIGSINERIQLVSYWPDIELDDYINLKDRVEGRMVIADVTATGKLPCRYTRSEVCSQAAEWVWFDFPLALTFSALLNAPGLTRKTSSDLARLNAARAKRGRSPLMDHIEVSLDLGSHCGEGQSKASCDHTSPRLHYVQGHWSTAATKHFGGLPIYEGTPQSRYSSKTVRVTASNSAFQRVS
jgi:hypothetical protein